VPGEPSTGADERLAYFAAKAPACTWPGVDRAGQVEGTVGQSQEGITARLSPDGTREWRSPRSRSKNATSGSTDLARGTRTRLTFDSTIENNPAWNPAGDRVLFSGSESPSANIYMQPADGSGKPRSWPRGSGDACRATADAGVRTSA
jgi:Tol biopolymer transport system component